MNWFPRWLGQRRGVAFDGAGVRLLERIGVEERLQQTCRTYVTAVNDPATSIVHSTQVQSKELLEQFQERFEIKQGGRTRGQSPWNCTPIPPCDHAPARQAS